jgi:hypothetical protein
MSFLHVFIVNLRQYFCCHYKTELFYEVLPGKIREIEVFFGTGQGFASNED